VITRKLIPALLVFITSALFILSACGEVTTGINDLPTPRPTETLLPLTPTIPATATEVVFDFTPTLTVEPTTTKIETPTATATEVEKKPMTMEDWKKVFTGTVVADNGSVRQISEMFDPTYYNIYTKEDVDKIRNLPMGTAFMILNPNGLIEYFGTPDYAADMALKGAVIQETKNYSAPRGIIAGIKAAELQWDKGETNIVVKFNKIPDSKEYFSMVLTLDRFKYSASVFLPENYIILDKAGKKIKSSDFDFSVENDWVVQFTKMGIRGIVLQSDNF